MTPKTVVWIVLAGTLALTALIVVTQFLYKVDQREYALELRFGEVRHVRTSPGLYIKAPFTDSVQRIDSRTLRADIPPREVPDRDKERLIIDVVVRYRITDPLAFRKTLRNEATAHERLRNIMYSAMRDTVGKHDRTDIIGAKQKTDDSGRPVNNEEGLPVYESLINTRDQIAANMHHSVAESVTSQQYGISIISVDIKRADFPPQVRSSIIDRLWAERQRIAARHRADGEEEYRKRTAGVQAQADILIAEARRDARQTRGRGEAEAISIVQKALEQDPEFYTFLRTLESYETSIQSGATLVLTDQPGGYLNTLANPPGTEDRGHNGDKNRGKARTQR